MGRIKRRKNKKKTFAAALSSTRGFSESHDKSLTKRLRTGKKGGETGREGNKVKGRAGNRRGHSRVKGSREERNAKDGKKESKK